MKTKFIWLGIFAGLLTIIAVLLVVFKVANHEQEAFTSPDLKWAHLQGHVKSVTTTISYDGSTYDETMEFDEDGMCIFASEVRVDRNDGGQITMTAEEEYKTKYFYNEAGYLESQNSNECDWSVWERFTLDERGWIVSSESEGCGDYTINTFSYSDIDENGNWLKATEESVYEEEGEKISATETITRKITYWE